MKKLLLSFAIATAIVTTWVSARAADLPSAPVYQPAAAPVVVQRVYNWTGFYLGVNGGYGWGSQDPLNIITNRFDSFSTGIAGGAFGGTLGAQIQAGHVVMGLEADLDWADISGSSFDTPTVGGIRRLGGTVQREDQYRLGKHRKGARRIRGRQLALLWDRRRGFAGGQDHPHHRRRRNSLRRGFCQLLRH